MFAKERQALICDSLKKNGAVTTGGLVSELGVSIETVRRDLLDLEKAGRLTRVHGGAVAAGDMQPPMELYQRNRSHSPQKQALSRLAAEYVSEGEFLAVDSGSTAILFAQALKERFRKLTVVTHSRDVFDLLCDHKDFTVLLCGGHYLRQERAFYGPLVLDALGKLRIQKSFLFPSAVSLEDGICDYQQELLSVQKSIISIAEQVYILADSSKFEKKALLRLADMDRRYTYITDGQLPAEIRNLYLENGIRIYAGGPL